jgi:hypothetical protein
VHRKPSCARPTTLSGLVFHCFARGAAALSQGFPWGPSTMCGKLPMQRLPGAWTPPAGRGAPPPACLADLQHLTPMLSNISFTLGHIWLPIHQKLCIWSSCLHEISFIRTSSNKSWSGRHARYGRFRVDTRSRALRAVDSHALGSVGDETFLLAPHSSYSPPKAKSLNPLGVSLHGRRSHTSAAQALGIRNKSPQELWRPRQIDKWRRDTYYNSSEGAKSGPAHLLDTIRDEGGDYFNEVCYTISDSSSRFFHRKSFQPLD